MHVSYSLWTYNLLVWYVPQCMCGGQKIFCGSSLLPIGWTSDWTLEVWPDCHYLYSRQHLLSHCNFSLPRLSIIFVLDWMTKGNLTPWDSNHNFTFMDYGWQILSYKRTWYLSQMLLSFENNILLFNLVLIISYAEVESIYSRTFSEVYCFMAYELLSYLLVNNTRQHLWHFVCSNLFLNFSGITYKILSIFSSYIHWSIFSWIHDGIIYVYLDFLTWAVVF